MFTSLRFVLSGFSIAVALFTSGESLAVTYRVTDLGTLQGSTKAYAINDSGQIVGESSVNGVSRAFLYSGGSLQNLGTLGGTSSVAWGINNSGVVVGTAALASGTVNAFSFYGGSLQSLGTATTTDGSVSFLSSAAFDINTSGQAVGSSSRDFTNGTTNSNSVLFANGTVTLKALGQLNAINDAGIMVGTDNGHGYVKSSTSFTEVPAFCGGGFCGSDAQDINNMGVVVGDATTFSARHAFTFASGSLSDLGTLGGANSKAFALNELGQVVGTSDSASGQHAFLYGAGTMQDINSLIDPASGWILKEARDINEFGQIVGWGLHNGQTSAFLLTTVPVPAAAWLLGSGLIGLAGVARTRGKSS